MINNFIETGSILLCAAMIAGFTDTLAGGGGLLTIPALLLSGFNPIIAFGTNKLQAAIGEFSAVWYFMRSKKISYKVLKVGLIYTFIGSIFGTIFLQFIPIKHLEKLVPFLLLSVLLYFIYNTFLKKRYKHNINTVITHNNKAFLGLGTLIGFYNGFFGPGTGSIWAVSLMHKFKLGLKEATMYAKPLNMVGNFTALIVFIIAGKVDYKIALLMGVGAFIGAKLGAHFVAYRSLKWLKILFFSLMLISTIATFIKYYT